MLNKFLRPLGTEGCVVSSVLSVWALCSGGDLTHPVCVPHVLGMWNFIIVPSGIKWALLCIWALWLSLTLSILWQAKIPDFLAVIWDKRDGNRPTPPVLCDNTREHQEASESLARCHGLVCCLCMALHSLPALMSHGLRWRSQSHRGDTVVPLSKVHWHRCVASLWQLLQDLQLPCKGQQLWGQRWAHHAAPGWYLRLGCSSWVD